MTRETKIGLLVGLAFIIVIGILLSDHLTSSTEPPPVNYTDAGNQVRGTVVAPGNVQNNAPVVIQRQVQPQQQVPTPRDIQRPMAPAEVVKIAVGGASISSSQNAPETTRTPIALQSEPPIKFEQSTQPIRANEGPTGTLAQIAANAGEPLTQAYPGGPTQNPAQVASVDPNSREYVAQPGDSLSKITAKVYGTSTKERMDAIIALNPTLQKNPNMIVAGKSYRVPNNSTLQSAAASVPAPEPTPAPTAPAQRPSQTISSNTANGVWYTVKPGDTLTSIASEELGDSSNSAVEAIKALNHDTLPDPNILKINQKIRLPAKPVAVVN